MKENVIIRNFNKKINAKYYSSSIKSVLSNRENGNHEKFLKNNLNNTFFNLLNKNKYNTYKSRVFNSNMYNNLHPNYANNNEYNNNNNNINNNNNNFPNTSNYKYDIPNYYQSKYNSNVNNENSDNTSYQYFNIFGSIAMCLIKPIFPDCITNKNKLTIYGKGGFQFMFMKKQSNSNKYDKNNKMNIFIKIGSLSNVLFLSDTDKLICPIVIKGGNNNYLIFDKHKEKKDHIVLKYKYQLSSAIDNNFNEMNTNLNADLNDNININDIDDDKKNNFEELYVSFPFSEFLIFQKAAKLLLPQLLGWMKQT